MYAKTPTDFRLSVEILAHILWERTTKPPLANAWVWELWRASPFLSTVPMTDGVARCALESKVPVAFWVLSLLYGLVIYVYAFFKLK